MTTNKCSKLSGKYVPFSGPNKSRMSTLKGSRDRFLSKKGCLVTDCRGPLIRLDERSVG